MATGVGFLFDWAQVPVAWLCGPMVVGICGAMIRGEASQLPSTMGILGQVIIGLGTATHFPLETLQLASTHAIPLLLIVIITGTMSLLNGYLLGRWAGIDQETAFLGCLPGASASIVAMSDEMGADAIAVAVLQYLRLSLVVFIVPLAVGWIFPVNSLVEVATTLTGESHLPIPILLNLLVLALCGWLGVLVGRKLNFPSPVFLGPVLVGLVTSWVLPYQFQVPDVALSSGLLLVGISIGVRFDWKSIRQLCKAVFIETGLVIVLIVLCLVIGYGFHLLTGVDIMTAVLGSTPGGMQAMIASAVELGCNTGLVLAMQMTRLLMILLISPWLAAALFKSPAIDLSSKPVSTPS